MRIVNKDEEYISYEITDNLKRTNQINIKEQKTLDQLAKREEFAPFLSHLIPIFTKCLEYKAKPVRDHRDLVTLTYLIDALKLLDTLPIEHHSLDLEGYFYTTETSPRV